MGVRLNKTPILPLLNTNINNFSKCFEIVYNGYVAIKTTLKTNIRELLNTPYKSNKARKLMNWNTYKTLLTMLKADYGLDASDIVQITSTSNVRTRTNNNASTYLETDYEVITNDDAMITIYHDEVMDFKEATK